MPPPKKRPAAAAAAADDASTAAKTKKAREDAEKFAGKIAVHLRDASERSGKPWDVESIVDATKTTAENLPEGKLRETLLADIDAFAAIVARKTTNPTPEDEPGRGEYGGPDDDAFHALRRKKRTDYDDMTLAELTEETAARVDRASFDPRVDALTVPGVPRLEKLDERELLEVEAIRADGLESAAEVAEATTARFVAGARATPPELPDAATLERLSAVLESVAALASERRREAIEFETLRNPNPGKPKKPTKPNKMTKAAKRAAACASRVVMARHAFRRATPKDRRPRRDLSVVAGHDAATLCGDVRWFLLRELAKTIPDDVGGGDGEEATDADAAGGGGGGEKKKKPSKKKVVGVYGVNDLCLFEAALGLGGFDEAFEAKEASSTHGPFAALATSAGADEAAGPALLPPFIADPRLAAADYEALRPDASLRDVIMSYERALLPPNDDWNIMEDDENEDGYEDDDVDDDAEELEHVDAYVALLKVIRAAALIARVGGDVRKAEDLARFAGRAPCPTTLSMQLPAGKVNVSDARATSVELCAAKGELWRDALAAWAATREVLSDVIGGVRLGGDGDGDGDGGFFFDVDGAAKPGADPATLAAMLARTEPGSKRADGSKMSAEEEEELVEMLRKNRAFLGGEDADDGVLDNLSDEDEQLPVEARKAAVQEQERILAEAEAAAAADAAKKKKREEEEAEA